MSQRTILEINHDYSHEILAQPNFTALLARALASGSPENWEPLKRFGIIRIVQKHHSEVAKVVVGIDDTAREYFV